MKIYNNNVRECDVLVAIHKHREYGVTQMKYILARISHTDETYFFPDADLGRAKFGKATLWDEDLARKIAMQKETFKEHSTQNEFENIEKSGPIYRDGEWF